MALKFRCDEMGVKNNIRNWAGRVNSCMIRLGKEVAVVKKALGRIPEAQLATLSDNENKELAAIREDLDKIEVFLKENA